MSRARRQLAARAAGGSPHEPASTINCTCGDPGPYCAPGQMSDWHHGMHLNCGVGIRQNLFCCTGGLECEAGAASPAHSKRLPIDDRLELIVGLDDCEKHLIGWWRIGGAPSRGQDGVGLGTVGEDSCTFLECNTRFGSLDG